MAKRITETELILPSLYLMSLNGGQITTTELKDKLRDIMKPDGEDLRILANRKDDKFSQKVRNLRSHETFERSGYAEYQGSARSGFVEINEAGKEHLEKNKDLLRYLLINDFAYEDLTANLKMIEANAGTKRIEPFDENIIIEEGLRKITESSVYVRSKLLRDFAITKFTMHGRIDCSCCKFNFADFYGTDIGGGFIEIHHIKPIFQYDDESIVATIGAAITNLAPVCSNCHRMIHRNWSKPLEIQFLIQSIDGNGVFKRFDM